MKKKNQKLQKNRQTRKQTQIFMIQI